MGVLIFCFLFGIVGTGIIGYAGVKHGGGAAIVATFACCIVLAAVALAVNL